MDIKIKARNGTVSSDVEKYAESKVAKLDKLSPRLQQIVVNLEENASKKKDKSHRVEILLYAPGQTLKSEEEKDSFYGAVDAAVDKLKRQLKRVRTRNIDRNQEGVKLSEYSNGVSKEVERVRQNEQAIVYESYSPMPITLADALKELTGDKRFTVFVSDQGSVNAVYRRDDGGLTLIVPDA